MNNTTTKAAETAKKAGTTRNTGVRTMVQIAMLAAVATVLMNLIDGAYLKKQGAARSTVYVKNTEREY